MKKITTWILCAIVVLFLTIPALGASESHFVLTVCNANSMIIEPEYISYTPGQTVKEALLASDHSFGGLEQGFVYEVDGVSGNFTLFYDENGYNLEADASNVTALCIGVSSQYSLEAIQLMIAMANYRQNTGQQNYSAAQEAYRNGLTAIRMGNAQTAEAALQQLNQAIQAYEAILNGPKYTVSVSAVQGEQMLTAPVITMTDSYGNRTTVTGTEIKVVAGSYSFSVSDGNYSRTEGTVSVSADQSLMVTLPDGDWFGKVKLLDGNQETYPYVQNMENHQAVYQIPDVAKQLGNVYLYVEQGAVPDANRTLLRTIYTGTNSRDYSQTSRSWQSTATALTYLVEPGMEGREFQLEAQYTDENGYIRIQSYQMILERVPTLKNLSVTADGTVLPIDFDAGTNSYDLTTVSEYVTVAAEGFGSDYQITGTGLLIASGQHAVTVSANGKSTVYTLNIQKLESVAVTLSIPDGVDVTVRNRAGSVIVPKEEVYYLVPGEEYTYQATKNTWYHTSREFTAAQGLILEVQEPETTDWLSNLALYNGMNAQTRTEYELDRVFSSRIHSYTVPVSDCNATLYAQATSEENVTACYQTQTTNASTFGKNREVTISSAVSKENGAVNLPQAVCRSGYGNTVTLKVSRTEGDTVFYQEYTFHLIRELHMTALSGSLPDGEVTLQDRKGNTCSFDRDVTEYQVRVNREETALYLDGTFPNNMDTTDCCGGYYVLVNETRYETLDSVEVPLNGEKDTEQIEIQVCHRDSQAVKTVYTMTVQKTDPVAVTIQTDPGDAIVYLVNDLSGKRILGDSGVYSLTPGVSYSYTVTRAGYQGVSGSYTAPEMPETKTVHLTKVQVNTSLQQLSSIWPHLRQNADNNGVISARTPVKDEEAVLYWATKIGDGFDSNACGCPILVDGYLYTYAGTTIYKVDTVSGAIVATGTMDHASSFAINPPTYADGMLFVGLADGTVQAFNAATLESLWIYRDSLGGQPNSSIVYHDGYVYTGFWVGETSQANYVCISATDEDPSNPKEEKLASWKYTSQGGFYWAGACVSDGYLLVGTDDGASGYTTGKAKLLSFDPLTGELLDSWTMGVPGDIRSSITAYNGRYYFTNKGGYFFEATVSEIGEIQQVRAMKLYNYASNDSAPPMSTCTPVIYNGRAYVGVSGTSQFGAYSGHNITVIDIPNWEIAYTVRTQGYPQTSGVLTTAYEKETGDVYVYFFDNYTPGKLRMLQDRPGQTSPSLVSVESYLDKGTVRTFETAYNLFTPQGEQAQYAICSPIVDEYGTIYFKNDSAYLMAVGSTVDRLEITGTPEQLTYQVGETFNKTGLRVTAHYTNGLSRDVTDYVTWSEEPLTEQDCDFVITMPYVCYQNVDGTSGTECPKPFVVLELTVEEATSYGDVDGDGEVKMTDVVLLLQMIRGETSCTDQQKRAADVNGDGELSMKDLTLILQHIQGNIQSFPVESGADSQN